MKFEIKLMNEYRVRQRGCSLPHSARTPPARDRHNFLGRGFFGGQGIFWICLGSGDFVYFFGLVIFRGAEDFLGLGVYFGFFGG